MICNARDLRCREVPCYAGVTLKDISAGNFGFLIAYLAPGFTALWGMSHFSPDLHVWLTYPIDGQPNVGGFLYVTLASAAVGVIVSAIRWVFLDSLHHCTGIPRPEWDIPKLQHQATAYSTLQQMHYRYYEFYGGMFIATLFTYSVTRFDHGFIGKGWAWIDSAVVCLELVLFFGARDTFRKYCERSNALLRKDAATLPTACELPKPAVLDPEKPPR